MDIIVERGAGLDVHKETVVACIMGIGIKKEIRTFSTMTNDLLQLKIWLKGHGITHIAMESTGVYWKPIFNILEDTFEVILVNARHVKNVPGRKTDVKDSEWLCKLLRSGLVRGSFIPPKEIRELRDLTRYRRKLIQAVTSEKQRIEKILEDANIKLSSVVSDIFGVSGTRIIEELMKGDLEVGEMAELSKGKLRKKKDDLKEALVGHMETHHVFMIKASLNHIRALEEILSTMEQKITEKIDLHYKEEYKLLQTIPPVKDSASVIIAEMGVNMNLFPTEMHLSSWSGMSPGNNESAGKKKPGTTTHGNKCLKSILTELAWVASRMKGTYLRAKYQSLVGRRGKKRALIAVGHKILIMCYHILKYKVPCKELGGNYLDMRKKDRIVKNYIKRLTNLGFAVTLNEAA
ncbi:MAG: IS110 family transposase [Syntrophus sp. (in: bacteria)]|nr:IS110 family transposase [Syntrophus sp. (in: bacteria)]